MQLLRAAFQNCVGKSSLACLPHRQVSTIAQDRVRAQNGWRQTGVTKPSLMPELRAARHQPYSPGVSHAETLRDVLSAPHSDLPASIFDELTRSRGRSSVYNGGLLIGLARTCGSFMSVSYPPIAVALSVLGTAALEPSHCRHWNAPELAARVLSP